MNLNDLQTLVDQGESDQLEFKKSTGLLKSAFESVCAFLNGDGGKVLIGVTDKGKIVGQEITDKTRQEIANEIAKIEPPTKVDVKYISLGDNKNVIMIDIKKGNYRPYIYESRPFLRNESSTIRMPQHFYEQLLVKRGHLNYKWDESLATGYTIDDLDHEEIRRVLKYGIVANRIPDNALNQDIPDILENLKLARDQNLTNAAVLLFARDVRPNYPQCHIKMARFQGVKNTESFIDNKRFYGNAFQILSEANNFIRRNLAIASFYQEDSLERIDKPALPVLAVREALINAICHRDYSSRSSYIAIEIYDDRLEIWSTGLLTEKLTIEDLQKRHKSYPRNQLVAELFYNSGFVEGWGTGTTKMVDLCREHGISAPEFQEYSGGLAVIFRFRDSVGSSDKRILKNISNLSSRQRDIIDILQVEGDLSAKNIALKLKEQIPDRTLRYDLSVLQSLNLVERKGRANSATWSLRKNNN